MMETIVYSSPFKNNSSSSLFMYMHKNDFYEYER